MTVARCRRSQRSPGTWTRRTFRGACSDRGVGEAGPRRLPARQAQLLIPGLNMVLWRGEVSDVPGDQAYTFQAASIHAPGYYQGAALKQLLRETTHPPWPPAPAVPTVGWVGRGKSGRPR